MLKSKTQLRRKTPLRARAFARHPQQKRDRGEHDDPAYLDYLRRQLCRAPGLPPHPGGDPHHVRHQPSGGGVGLCLKAPDARAISLCRRCHNDIDALAGAFKGWDRARLHAWLEAQIVDQRAAYLAAHPQPIPF